MSINNEPILPPTYQERLIKFYQARLEFYRNMTQLAVYDEQAQYWRQQADRVQKQIRRLERRRGPYGV